MLQQGSVKQDMDREPPNPTTKNYWPMVQLHEPSATTDTNVQKGLPSFQVWPGELVKSLYKALSI